MKENRPAVLLSGIVISALTSLALLDASPASAATIEVPQDFTTIQEAVDNADENDTVSITKAKRYEETVSVATNDLTIKGKDGVVIDPGTEAGFAIDAAADGFTVQNLRMQHGNGGVKCTGNGCTVRNVEVGHGDTGEDCVRITGNDAKILDSTLRPCGNSSAIELDGDNFKITGNKISQVDSYCLDLSGDGGEITDNDIHNCEDSEGIYLSSGSDDIQIANNQIAATDGEAIEATGNNLRVTGNFVENIEDNCIRGNGDDNLYKNNVIEGCYDNGIEVSGDRVKVIGNDILAADPGGDDCIDVNGGIRPVVKKNVVDICDGGFEVSGENPQVIGNKGTRLGDDEGFDIDCFDVPDGAVLAEACATAVLRNNTASGNNNDDEGFDVNAPETTGEGFQIVGNTSKQNNDGGFYLVVFGAIIEDNVSKYDGSEGNEPAFEIGGGGENEVTGNLATGSAEDGFYVSSSANILRGNVARENFYDGFNLIGADNVLVGNEAYENHGDGFDNGGTDVTLKKNIAEGNDYVDCANDGTIAVNQNNDCADGSDFAVPGGIGT